MMKIVFTLLLSSVLIAAIFADEFDSRTKEANYDGYVILPPKLSSWETLITVYFLKRYKLIRTNLLHPNQAIELQNWEEDFDFWKPPKSGFSTDILVEPGQLETLSNQLKVGKSQKSFLFCLIFKKMNKITATQLFNLPNEKSLGAVI